MLVRRKIRFSWRKVRWNKMKKTSVEWNGDSVQIYNNLIAEENDDSHYGPNVAGMVIGGLLVGGGTFFSVVAVNAASDADWLSAVGAGLFTAASVPFYLVGLPIFLYNTYKFADSQRPCEPP